MRNLVLVAIACLAFAPAIRAEESCTQCHSDRERLDRVVNGDEARAKRVFVDPEVIKTTVHGELSCADCHLNFVGYPHAKEGPTTPGCADCHKEAAGLHTQSVHGKETACTDCHGVHDVFAASNSNSRMHPLNVTRTCGKCHFEGIDATTASVDELLEQHYASDMHGHSLLKHGLTVSATCVSCHGAHDTRAEGDPASRVSRANVSQVCGACHTGELEAHQKSVHALAADGEGATCTDCHSAHSADDSDSSDYRVESIKHCGDCHERSLASFINTHHGKVTTLGYGGRVADCASCHGAHAILASNDPHSRIHADNLVTTCAECHEGAHEAFVGYKVHAVWDGGEGSDPLLSMVYIAIHSLLVGTIVFGLIHILLWLVRATAAGDWKNRPRGGRTVRRWRTFYVQLHVVFMTSFTLLAATGLPLRYAEQPWARRMMTRFGSPESAGWLHRFSAIVMMICIAAYLIHIATRLIVGREKGLFTGPNTMLPRKKDFSDFFGNLRWFLFIDKRPRFDRWCYWEKFDFWAVFWGMVIIGGTGLVLWFPVEATWFMPGWMVNVSEIVHGHEALLAVAFIFTFHIFHANLRPDKFPIDPLFLTGRLPEDELKHDRPMEYDRLVEEGKLDGIVDKAPERGTLRLAYLFGGLVMLIGIVLVVYMWSASRG